MVMKINDMHLEDEEETEEHKADNESGRAKKANTDGMDTFNKCFLFW